MTQPPRAPRLRASARATAAALQLIAAALLLAGCGSTQIFGARTGGVEVGSRRTTGWATKEVVEKKAPETLLAADGSMCRVSPDRFADTKLGALVPCEWQ